MIQPQKLSTSIQSAGFVINLPEYENIELSVEEMEAAIKLKLRELNRDRSVMIEEQDLPIEARTEALRVARGIKQGILNEIEYVKKVNKTQREIPDTAEYLYEGLKTFYVKTNGQFVDTQGREKIYMDLCYYFAHDKNFSGNLSKGLLVRGEIGCGKTTLFEFFRHSKRKFNIVPCRKVSYDFKEKGVHAVAIYGKNHSDYPNIGTCFDDLGTEPDTKNFGDKLNVMAEVLLMRYETKSVNTIITTNLTDSQLMAGYEARVYDRLKEMFNVVTIPGGSLR